MGYIESWQTVHCNIIIQDKTIKNLDIRNKVEHHISSDSITIYIAAEEGYLLGKIIQKDPYQVNITEVECWGESSERGLKELLSILKDSSGEFTAVAHLEGGNGVVLLSSINGQIVEKYIDQEKVSQHLIKLL